MHVSDRTAIDTRSREFFDDLWREGDPWSFESAEFDRGKYDRQIELVADRRYGRALEIGCGAGAFTRKLAAVADAVVAIDVAPAAIARARDAVPAGSVEFMVANAMEFDPAAQGPWDLIVLSETVYYLGWLYPFFDVAWLARRLFDATVPGGRLVMSNTCGELRDYLLRPWVIRTYRDLFVNVGYQVEYEERFHGQKNGIELEALTTVYAKPRPALPLDLVLTPLSRRPTELPAATDAYAREATMPPVRSAGPPHASVVVATSNNVVFLKLCLASVLGSTGEFGFEVVIVDNGSSDGTAAFLSDLERSHACVRVIRNDHNAGFAVATNQGLAAAAGDVFVLLNDDTIVPPHWLEDLCGHLTDPAVGLLGPVTNRTGNGAQVDAQYETYGELLKVAAERQASRGSVLRDLPMLTMFCLAMRRGVYERIGPLDEQFEIGMFEDDDYAERVRRAGLRIACAEGTFVHHFGATSLGKLAAEGQYGSVFEANRRRFEAKWQVSWSRSRRATAQYDELIARIHAVVRRSVPPDAPVAFVSRGDDALISWSGGRGWHFPQTPEGTYSGYHPATGVEVVEALKSVRERGARYLVLPETAFWWLERYPEFRAHLDAEHQLLSAGDECMLFELAPAEVER